MSLSQVVKCRWRLRDDDSAKDLVNRDAAPDPDPAGILHCAWKRRETMGSFPAL